MLELSRQVADRAVEDLALWRAGGLDVSVSLNVAAPELTADAFVPYLLARLTAAGLAPHHMTLEVAEDSFIAAPERVTQALTEARHAGLRASLDEYGSGFSSLTYLRDLRAVSEIKLDRPFTAGICTDSRSAVIVSSTVAMAHALGMTVVAGGVETELLAARAIVLGVDALQGFYLSRPMPADGVVGFVRALEVGAATG
jgi:EAL domain-containing protein (putative c-di-GMP-specific phosphodiesterase class I)